LNEESLFVEALEKSTGAERQAFLEEACAGDVGLRERVEQLLEAHEKTLGILDQSVRPPGWTEVGADSAHGSVPTGELVGTLVAGRYKLLRVIGTGGMGTVWLAEQTQPVRRKVALKLIKAGMDSRTVLSRFDAERQALALMDHPNIARVLDGGATESGRPFFVMEYVEGVPITRYCDDARLSIADRLALFVPVCQAVQHSHTKGVIHRDLKPNNILVSLHDGQPVPKVIDFGLAKAIQEPLTERTLHTAHGVLVGTPLYMSPEQAELNNLDVDTRTDVYALGVILYELLTGTTPLERKRFHEAAWLEMLRLIKEEEPPRPSDRLSSSDSLPSLAAQRNLEPVRLTRLIRGELDWIVMKCLEKDRTRRYETANGLARDIQRYLTDESVEACPPSFGYRLRKFVRRNRGPVLATSVIFLLLVGGIAGTTWGLIRADQAREAEAKRAEGEKRANAQAQERLQQVARLSEILASVFNDIDPRSEEKDDKPLRAILGERLSKAADQLEGEGVGDPLLVADLQNRLGLSLLHLDLAQRAIPLFEKSRAIRTARLGADHPDTIDITSNLANSYTAGGKADLALPLLEETLRLRKASLGADHVNTLSSMHNLAGCYRDVGKLDQSLALYEETFRLRKARLGADHVNTLNTMSNLANSYKARGKADLALPLLEETLRLRKASLGADHVDTRESMMNLADGYREFGRMGLALPLLEETLKLFKAKEGPDHPRTLAAMNNLGSAYRSAGKLDKALPHFREAATIVEKRRFELQGAETVMINLIVPLEELKQFDEAEAWRRKWLAVVKGRAGADSPQYGGELGMLGANLRRQDKWTDAESVLREALTILEKKVPTSVAMFIVQSELGSALLGQKRYAEAEPLLVQAYEGIKAREAQLAPTDRPRLVESGDRVIQLYEAWGKPEKAAEWRTKLPAKGEDKPKP
jgi:serine/threonine protein kinase/tetratricopeptide (TPR) repeat protein